MCTLQNAIVKMVYLPPKKYPIDDYSILYWCIIIHWKVYLKNFKYDDKTIGEIRIFVSIIRYFLSFFHTSKYQTVLHFI